MRNPSVTFPGKTLILRATLVVLWLFGSLPSLVNGLLGGRTVLYTGFTLQTTAPAAAAIQGALAILLAGGAIVTVATHLAGIGSRRPGVLPITLAAILIPVFLSEPHRLQDVRTAALILVVLAVWAAQPDRGSLSLIGILTALGAGTSLLIGWLTPWGLMTGADQFAEKALTPLGTLAGVYNHSNTLGLALVIGSPFIMFVKTRSLRIACYAVVGIALVWSSSRSSIIAAGLLMLVVAFGRWTRRPAATTGIAFVAALATIFVLPLSTSDPNAYSGRGLIWMATLLESDRSPVLGWGAAAFQPGSPIVNMVGYSSTHGHNLFTTVLGRHGTVGLALAVAALLTSAFLASKMTFRGVSLCIFPLALAFSSIVEGRFDFDAINELSYAAIPAFLISASRVAPPSRLEPTMRDSHDAASFIRPALLRSRSD